MNRLVNLIFYLKVMYMEAFFFFSFVKLKILVLEMMPCKCSTFLQFLFPFCLPVPTDVLQVLGQLL